VSAAFLIHPTSKAAPPSTFTGSARLRPDTAWRRASASGTVCGRGALSMLLARVETRGDRAFHQKRATSEPSNLLKPCPAEEPPAAKILRISSSVEACRGGAG
jgi:hypothetical protein